MNKTLFSAAAIAATLLALGSNAALAQVAPPTKVYASGSLIGLNGVDLAGTLYDVRFVSGANADCASTFSGCDSNGDFTFGTISAASQANQAMASALDHGDFSPQGAVNDVHIYTPYALDGQLVRTARTQMDGGTEATYESAADKLGKVWGASLYNGQREAWAIWTPSVSAVPEPGTYALLAAGLAAVGFMARRRTGR